MIWQTKQWGKMLQNSQQVVSLHDIEGIQVEKRQVSMGEYGLFVLGVPNVVSNEAERKLIELCSSENCLFIQYETCNYRANTSPQSSPERRGSSFSLGSYKKFITPYTAVIDLSKTEEEILTGMKPKGRYNIKLARKKGVEVKSVEKTDANIAEFFRLMSETTSRDKFAGNTQEYYTKFLENLPESKLLFAILDGVVVAAGIFVFTPEVTIYYYGASSGDGAYRNIMAPYLLQWEAIKVAKKVGSRYYDFLGVAGPDEINSPLKGVTNFKKKLTKDIREVSLSYIWVNKKIKYKYIQVLRGLRNIFKK